MSAKQIAIIDYGMGNTGSVANALKKLGANVFLSSKYQGLKTASAFVLPGVGAFPQAMENLHKLGLVDYLTEAVIEQKTPILGICLGMQLMAMASEEIARTEGLGWIKARVVPIQAQPLYPVPHVGWNTLAEKQNNTFFNRIDPGAHYFFDHAYHVICQDQQDVLAQCEYGIKLTAVIRRGNIFATQFHPEKSQRNGLKLLRNYLNYIEGVH